MIVVRIKNTEIGRGIPKICVSLTGTNRNEVLSELGALEGIPHDIIEWRADYFGGRLDINAIISFLEEISGELKNKPFLFTFRTKKEGGAKEITEEDYLLLNEKVIETGKADIVDVELFIGDYIVKRLINAANKKGVRILASNCDIEKTPSKDVMIKRLIAMQELGADIAKIEVTPLTVKDVAQTMDVMAEMLECYADKPFVVLATTGAGVISTVAGEIFGSAIAYCSPFKQSSRGMLNVADLDSALKIIHDAYKTATIEL